MACSVDGSSCPRVKGRLELAMEGLGDLRYLGVRSLVADGQVEVDVVMELCRTVSVVGVHACVGWSQILIDP